MIRFIQAFVIQQLGNLRGPPPGPVFDDRGARENAPGEDHQQPQDDGDGVNLRRPPVLAPNIQQLIQQQVLEQLRNLGFQPGDPAAEGARVAPQPSVPGRRVPPTDGDPLQREIPPARGAIPVPEGQPENVPERTVMREILQELQLQREARERERQERERNEK
ncbi:acidic proline-rich protein PRP33 [Diachasma alloeum]|uniref:acidic proline-rich protein PRP33 n=1 Tax=Diachasma alloeum TaxID=454923 RepID=UPI0007382FB2|nr:acidic proline-rich protein PRP33 [Diachasma alloeum]